MKYRKIYYLLFLFILTFILVQPVGLAASFFDSVSLGLEKEIGYYNYQQITSEKRVVQLSPAEEVRLNTIFLSLVDASGRRKEVKYNISVVKDNTVNAFALPGGYVFVHTGLLSFAQTDGELAGVLAHEIAHVDRRHSMQAVTRSLGMAFIVGAVMGGNSKHKEQVAQMAQISMGLLQLGYSRDAEYQADQYGVKFMQRAGYNKQEILNFWRRLEGPSGNKNSSALIQMFSTHPPTAERIKRIEAMQ